MTKCAAVKFVKPWMSSHISELRDPSYVGLAMCQNVPWKNGEASASAYTHGKAAQRLSKDQVEWLHLWTWLVPSWCGASKNIWDCCWSWGILGLPRAASPAILLRGKLCIKMNEYRPAGRCNDVLRECSDQWWNVTNKQIKEPFTVNFFKAVDGVIGMLTSDWFIQYMYMNQ